jgi:hypothetical protein
VTRSSVLDKMKLHARPDAQLGWSRCFPVIGRSIAT